MDQTEIPFSIRCPHHKGRAIVVLNVDLNAKKPGYCYECIAQNGRDGSPFQTLKTVSTYLKDTSDFYETCRQRVHNAGEPPAEFIEELSKKGERLGKLSQHIDQEKDKVKKNFEEIRMIVNQIINEKEKECLELLDKEIMGASEAYTLYEKLLIMGWPKPSDIRNIYPETDFLKQRMSQIESVGQLRAFMAGINKDVWIQGEYFTKDNALSRIKEKIDSLIYSLSGPEDSFPKIQGQVLNSENVENLMKDLMKGFIQQGIQVENSIDNRSKIMTDDQFDTLRNWLPPGYKFDLKLLFRGSVDGMSAGKFHEKCDDQGATITLIKCRFYGDVNSKIIGGFADQSWHFANKFSSSRETFFFSLAEQSHDSVKWPIFEPRFETAFQGHPPYAPAFGSRPDLYLDTDLKTGKVDILMNDNYKIFSVEEIEVFQVR